jgi:hypothetical protein
VEERPVLCTSLGVDQSPEARRRGTAYRELGADEIGTVRIDFFRAILNSIRSITLRGDHDRQPRNTRSPDPGRDLPEPWPTGSISVGGVHRCGPAKRARAASGAAAGRLVSAVPCVDETDSGFVSVGRCVGNVGERLSRSRQPPCGLDSFGSVTPLHALRSLSTSLDKSGPLRNPSAASGAEARAEGRRSVAVLRATSEGCCESLHVSIPIAFRR